MFFLNPLTVGIGPIDAEFDVILNSNRLDNNLCKVLNIDLSSALRLQNAMRLKIKRNKEVMDASDDIQWAQDSSLSEKQKENKILTKFLEDAQVG